MGAVKRETGGVVSQDGKPALTRVGLKCGVDDRRHKLLLVHHEPNGPRAPQHIDAYQQPLRVLDLALLLLAHQHRDDSSRKETKTQQQQQQQQIESE